MPKEIKVPTRITADGSQFFRTFKRVNKSINHMRSNILQLAGGIYVFQSLNRGLQGLIGSFDQTAKLARDLGTSNLHMMALISSFEQIGFASQQALKAFGMMERGLRRLRQGSLSLTGIPESVSRQLQQGDVFAFIEMLRNMNPNTATAVLTQMGVRQAVRTTAAIQGDEFAESLERTTKLLKPLNQSLSADTLPAFEAFNDGLTRLKTTLGAVVVSEAFGGATGQGLADKMDELIAAARDGLQRVFRLMGIIKRAIDLVPGGIATVLGLWFSRGLAATLAAVLGRFVFKGFGKVLTTLGLFAKIAKFTAGAVFYAHRYRLTSRWWKAALPSIKGFFAALGLTLKILGKAALVAGAKIAALVAGFYILGRALGWLWKRFAPDKAQKFVGDAVEDIKKATGLTEEVKTLWSELLEVFTVKEKAEEAAKRIKAAVDNVVSGLNDALYETIRFGEGLKDAWRNFLETVLRSLYDQTVGIATENIVNRVAGSIVGAIAPQPAGAGAPAPQAALASPQGVSIYNTFDSRVTAADRAEISQGVQIAVMDGLSRAAGRPGPIRRKLGLG